VNLTDSRVPCNRHFNFARFLSSVVPQPYLQTIDLTAGTGAREQYPVDTENVAPIVRMAYQVTPGIGGNGLVLGFLRIGANYSVRGRRAEILPVSVRLSLFTPSEREQALR
jgi:hypothetical protein